MSEAKLRILRTPTMPAQISRSRKIADTLSSAAYKVRSAYAIAMDDLVVHAIFTKVSTEQHIPQTLGVAFQAPGRALIALHAAFELKKEQLFSADGSTVLRAASEVVNIVRRDRDQPYFRELNAEELKMLQW